MISEVVVRASPTAVIAETTTWDAFPELWPALLDEVWQIVRSNAQISPGRNVMFYKDDAPSVEIGVEVTEPFPSIGRVVCSTLPAGRVVRATHRGRYEDLGLAHIAAIEQCEARGLQRLGPRWEIYAHFDETSAEQQVDVYYLVR